VSPRASVLIPSYNNKDRLLACIERFEHQTFPLAELEVVVVIDGSVDGSAAALRSLDTTFELRVVEQENSGRAAALNRAAAEARAEILIVTDSDILPNDAFVASHVAGQGTADVVLGPIPLSKQSPVSFLTDGVQRWADRHERRMLGGTEGIGCSEIYGANLSINKDKFEAIGGYRTDLRRTEDFQLGKKILNAGYSVAFAPHAVAEQIYDKTIPDWCNDFYYDGISHVRFVAEFPDEIPRLKLGSYYPQSLAKRLLRPCVRRNSVLGRCFVWFSTHMLELARAAGLRWRVLAAWKGVVGDALFWKGVHHELGEDSRFFRLVRDHRVDRED